VSARPIWRQCSVVLPTAQVRGLKAHAVKTTPPAAVALPPVGPVLTVAARRAGGSQVGSEEWSPFSLTKE
jgi:hypothetical protein